MSADKEYTYAEVSQHATKKDLLVVIHDNIYNASSFIDEHPGGEEVLLDVAGQDATEAFEDVGHSDEAREILAGLLVGKLNRKPGDPKPNLGPTSSKARPTDSGASSFGIGLYAIILIGGVAAYGAWKYLEAQPVKQ